MKPILFAFPENEMMAKKIAGGIDADIGKFIVRKFPDGETHIRILSEVKNKKAIIICSLNEPDNKIIPLYFISKTLRSLGVSVIELIAPYLSYMRQDRIFNPGEGITAVYFASLISTIADKLITVDPHLHRIQSLSEIYKIPSNAVDATGNISAYIRTHTKNPLLIGPDSESRQWVSRIAKNADAPFIILEKRRLGDNQVEISIPEIEKFSKHTPVLIDDIISTGETMIQTVKHLTKTTIHPVICIGVHAIFAGNAFENLKNSGVTKIITCNTIEHYSNEIDISDLIITTINKHD